jgi:hypothetical protein
MRKKPSALACISCMVMGAVSGFIVGFCLDSIITVVECL